MSEIKITIIAISTIIILLLFGWYGYSYCEARAYNSVTGKNITTGQAMFLQLRVDSGVK